MDNNHSDEEDHQHLARPSSNRSIQSILEEAQSSNRDPNLTFSISGG